MKNSFTFWENIYEQHLNTNESIWGDGSTFLDTAIRCQITSKTALDIGSGDGRNSIYLAQNGFSVDAFDISHSAIEKINNISNKLGLTINAYTGDITTIIKQEIYKKYDIVLLYGVLNSLSKEYMNDILYYMKKSTNKGGFNIIVTFIKMEPTDVPDGDYIHFFSEPDDINRIYSDWSLFEKDYRIFSHMHENLDLHSHKIYKVIFRNYSSP